MDEINDNELKQQLDTYLRALTPLEECFKSTLPTLPSTSSLIEQQTENNDRHYHHHHHHSHYHNNHRRTNGTRGKKFHLFSGRAER